MRRSPVPLLAAALCLALAGCAAPASHPAPPGTAAPPTSTGTTAPPAGRPALQVRVLGGFQPVGYDVARVPSLTVYADGLEIGEGPTPLTAPGPALPSLLERRIPPAQVRDLVARATAAGALERTDLGRPGVADASTVRITVATPDGTSVRDVYALYEGQPAPGEPPVSGPTPEQEAARARLRAFVDSVTTVDGPGRGAHADDWRPFVADRVAAVARPWTGGAPRLPRDERPWPGAALPGAALAPGAACALTTGAAAADVLTAARSANRTTRWTTTDGRAWQVLLRPLLPSETGCADLRTS